MFVTIPLSFRLDNESGPWQTRGMETVEQIIEAVGGPAAIRDGLRITTSRAQLVQRGIPPRHWPWFLRRLPGLTLEQLDAANRRAVEAGMAVTSQDPARMAGSALGCPAPADTPPPAPSMDPGAVLDPYLPETPAADAGTFRAAAAFSVGTMVFIAPEAGVNIGTAGGEVVDVILPPEPAAKIPSGVYRVRAGNGREAFVIGAYLTGPPG
jgi:hypothetical protein